MPTKEITLKSKPYAVRTTAEKGRGLFATVDIAVNTNLGEYSGLLCPDMGETSLTAFLGYLTHCTFGTDMLIDPEDKQFGCDLCMGNFSHEPNTEFREDDFSVHRLVTIKPIAKGEELTYSYNLDLPPTRYIVSKWKCLCGTDSCTGDMLDWAEGSEAEWQRDADEMKVGAIHLVKFLLKHGPRNGLQQRLFARLKADDMKWLPAKLRSQVRLHRG
jgi:hypothetical protein